ncbi:hypothetical protein ACWGKS_25990 [Nocardiopsis sp. NPDC055879]
MIIEMDVEGLEFRDTVDEAVSLFHPEGAGHSPVPVSPNPF